MIVRSSRRVDRQVATTLGEGALREWLLADGTGGYAMGTVSGLRTRRYHGLLVVATEPPLGRHLGLVSLDPVLSLPDGRAVRLATHEWSGGVVDPAGHELLREVEVGAGTCRWQWQLGDVVLEREVAVEHGRPSVAVVHRLVAGPSSGDAVTLRLDALCTWRDVHGERLAGEPLDVRHRADGAVVAGAYALRGPGWQPNGAWYVGVRAREEAARGLAPEEDVWFAGSFLSPLRPGEAAEVSAWSWAPDDPTVTLDAPPLSAGAVVDAARDRAAGVVELAPEPLQQHPDLLLAADAFVVARPVTGAVAGRDRGAGEPRGAGAGAWAGTGAGAGDRHGVGDGRTLSDLAPDVVAGYPWFGAWSRDTMISYEGLFLVTGRHDEGASLLRGYAATLSGGMLANTADTGAPEHNTVDGTLWFAHAVGRHVEVTGDTAVAADLREPLERVVAAHQGGTRYGIAVDPADGLLRQGVEGQALTWMDARVGGVGVTPRIGKPVEVQALWVRTLEVLADLRRRAGSDAADVVAAAERARESFAARFPAPGGWLHDVVDAPAPARGTGAVPAALVDDASLRPNQVLALAVPGRPLVGDDRAVAALDAVARALLTPLGLRSLSPDDPAYRGTHRGGPAGRDSAYHQGTVWPWLVGPYVTAVLRYGHVEGGRRRLHAARSVVASLLEHLDDWGVGSVSETADGDPPHAATGCPLQAWSVAELLRCVALLDAAPPPA